MTSELGGEFRERRSEKRLRVRLPVRVHGVDRSGARFEERTTSEDVCRGGVAITLAHEPDVGAELEVVIPIPRQGNRPESDFSTRGRVCHTKISGSVWTVGLQFTGPRFHHMFVSETAQ